jgi:hypothetical protein
MGKLKFLSHHLPRINPKVWQVFKRKKFFFDHVSEIYLMLFFLLKKKKAHCLPFGFPAPWIIYF